MDPEFINFLFFLLAILGIILGSKSGPTSGPKMKPKTSPENSGPRRPCAGWKGSWESTFPPGAGFGLGVDH